MIFNQKLIYLRQQYGFSLREISSDSNIGIKRLGSLESGLKYPTYNEINRLAKVFEMTLSELLYDVEEK